MSGDEGGEKRRGLLVRERALQGVAIAMLYSNNQVLALLDYTYPTFKYSIVCLMLGLNALPLLRPLLLCHSPSFIHKPGEAIMLHATVV